MYTWNEWKLQVLKRDNWCCIPLSIFFQRIIKGLFKWPWETKSTITEFLLLGLPADPHTQALLFVLFLVIYLLTLSGNLLMILVIGASSHLHIPMYFFLSHLSFLDLCYSSVTVPKVLENLLSEKKTISVEDYLTQASFVFDSGGTEFCLLAVMAYDLPSATLYSIVKRWAKSCVWDWCGDLGSFLFRCFHQYPSSLEYGLLWDSNHLQLHLWGTFSCLPVPISLITLLSCSSLPSCMPLGPSSWSSSLMPALSPPSWASASPQSEARPFPPALPTSL